MRGEYFDRVIETMRPDELRELQLRKLKRIVRFAWSSIPHYHRRFRECGLRPEDIITAEDFRKKVPMFTKNDIRLEVARSSDPLAGLVSCPMREVTNIALTSGTTGPNTFVAVSQKGLDEFVARQSLRELWMQRLRPGMRMFMAAAGWHLFGLLQNRAMTRLGVECVVPFGSQFPAFASQFVDAMRVQRPDYLLTVPTMLFAMIRACEESGVDPRVAFGSVKYVQVVGEALPFQARRWIRRKLRVRDIFEAGGSTDGVWGGGECWVHKGHHVWMDSNYLEVLDPKTLEPVGENERGVVVSTNLSHSRSVFIRFNCEDLAQQLGQDCPCGRTHTRIEILDRLANAVDVRGREVFPCDVAESFAAFPQTAECRFAMVDSGGRMDKLQLRAWHSGRRSDDRRLASAIEASIRERLEIEAVIDWVDQAALLPSGQKVQRIIRSQVRRTRIV